jgi:hypothetical protein
MQTSLIKTFGFHFELIVYKRICQFIHDSDSQNSSLFHQNVIIAQ